MGDLGAIGLVAVGILLTLAAFVIANATQHLHEQRAVVDAVHHGHAVHLARAGLVRGDDATRHARRSSLRQDADELADLAALPALAAPERHLRLVWSRPKIRDPSSADVDLDPPIERRRRDAGGSS